MKNLIIYIGILFFTINSSCAQIKVNDKEKSTTQKEKRDIINDAQTAIKIAEVILLSVYGEKIYESIPFKAELIKDDKVWFVRGTLNKKYTMGGVPFIEIQKKDCKILKFGHGK